jgi:hypothetical protein
MTPDEHGKCKAVWNLEAPDGRRIGKLKMIVKVVEPQVFELMKMGFKEKRVRRILQQADGDLSQAVSMLLR